MRPAPLPDDEVQREADRITETEHMIARLPLHEQAGAILNGPLAKVLARLATALDIQERESHPDPQPLLDSPVKGADGVGLIGQRLI